MVGETLLGFSLKALNCDSFMGDEGWMTHF